MVSVKELKKMKKESDRQYRIAIRQIQPRKWPKYLAMCAASAIIGYTAHYYQGLSELEQYVQSTPSVKQNQKPEVADTAIQEPAHTSATEYAAEINHKRRHNSTERQNTTFYAYGKGFNAHKVREGDTLASIARLYGKDPHSLHEYNRRWNRWFTLEPGELVLLQQLNYQQQRK